MASYKRKAAKQLNGNDAEQLAEAVRTAYKEGRQPDRDDVEKVCDLADLLWERVDVLNAQLEDAGD